MILLDGVIFARARSSEGWEAHVTPKGKAVERKKLASGRYSYRDAEAAEPVERVGDPVRMLARASVDNPQDLHEIADAFLDRGQPGDERKAEHLRRLASIGPPSQDWKKEFLPDDGLSSDGEPYHFRLGPRLRQAWNNYGDTAGYQHADPNGYMTGWHDVTPNEWRRDSVRDVNEAIQTFRLRGGHFRDSAIEDGPDYLHSLAEFASALGLAGQAKQIKQGILKHIVRGDWG